MVIIETSIFAKQISGLLSDDDYAAFQASIIENPGLGDLIPQSGGIRKVRCALPGTGKRGGARIIYFWQVSEDQIFMLLAYAKSDNDNLSPAQIKMLKQVVQEEFGK